MSPLVSHSGNRCKLYLICKNNSVIFNIKTQLDFEKKTKSNYQERTSKNAKSRHHSKFKSTAHVRAARRQNVFRFVSIIYILFIVKTLRFGLHKKNFLLLLLLSLFVRSLNLWMYGIDVVSCYIFNVANRNLRGFGLRSLVFGYRCGKFMKINIHTSNILLWIINIDTLDSGFEHFVDDEFHRCTAVCVCCMFIVYRLSKANDCNRFLNDLLYEFVSEYLFKVLSARMQFHRHLFHTIILSVFRVQNIHSFP